MKRLLITLACLVLACSCFAQNADDAATQDDIMVYLRTMHAHDLTQKTIQLQFQSMREMLRSQIEKEKGSVPADFDARTKKLFDDLASNIPIDEITQAMIPAYKKHFTHGDIEAMNAFYASPVGQKVLQELPAVMQESMQASMPILSKYISDSQERMKTEFDSDKASAAKDKSNNPPAKD